MPATWATTPVIVPASGQQGLENPMGFNLYTGGTASLEGSAFPIFQNQILASRGFTTGLNSTYANLNATGHPDGSQSSVTCILYSANADASTGLQFWFHNGTSYRTFKCGFTGNGAETVTGTGCTIANVTHPTGTTTTFDLTPSGSSSLFAFTISGITVALSAEFANLPDYPLALGMFTNEMVNHTAQFGYFRVMQAKDAWNNNTANNSTNRNTIANTPARKDWFSGTGTPGLDGYPDKMWLNLAAQANTGIWLHVPPNDDGTFASAMLTDAASTLPPGQKIFIEFSNELWNGIGQGGSAMLRMANNDSTDFQSAQFTGSISGTTLTVSGVTGTVAIGQYIFGAGIPDNVKINSGSGTTWTLSQNLGTIGSEAMTQTNYTLMYEYVGKRCHQLAAQARSIFGTTRYTNDVRIVFAVQIGANGRSFAFNAFNYMSSQGWVPSDDVYAISHAPYISTSNSLYRSVFTANIGSGSTNMTTTGVIGTITLGDLVFHPNIPAGTTIVSQTSGTTGGAGVYVISAATTGSLNVQVCSNLTTPTVAQLCNNLAGTDGLGNIDAANTVMLNATTEALVILAKFWNLKAGVCCYESGWPIDSELWSPNIGAAIMDPLMIPVEQSMYAYGFNSGISNYTRYEGGVNGIRTLTGSGPFNALDYKADNLIAGNSPRFKAMQAYFPGTFARTRNVISGPGSAFSAANSSDNYDGVTYPVMDVNHKGPPSYSVNGQVTYQFYCQQAGTYNLSIRFTNTSASAGTTKLIVDGTTLQTAVAIPGTGTNGGVNDVSLGAVPLTVGLHMMLLGGSNIQSITVSDKPGPLPGIVWN